MARNLFVGSETKNVVNNSRTFEERQEELELFDQLEEDRRKKEKDSAYTRWTQCNLKHTKELVNLALKHPKAHAILYFFLDHMDNYNALVCSHEVLEEFLGVSKSTVTRSIRALKDLNFITVLSSGTSNVYAINDSVFWKSWGKNRKYSKFPANVILTESEQKEFQLMKEKLTEVKVKSEK